MDKRALQSYAVWAKTNLENQIEVQLKTLGINSERDIKTARKVGERTIIDGDSNSYPGDLKEKRDKIIGLVQEDGYKQVIEEFAYTWFNRIVALRFMEVHDFLPHGFRVLSSRTGGFEPEILKNVAFVKDDLKLDVEFVNNLKSQGKIDEAYRYVLFRQCTALSGVLPMLFDSKSDYLELLLPKALLKGETFITKIREIDEDDFMNDVEVIGWLYQFYVASDRQAFRDAKVVTKDLIPTLTQVFTPDWIVRYMAENSVGRIWLESYPNSVLKNEMKYYVEDAEQEAETQRKLDEVKYKNVSPEDIKIIEPCCGSGHILAYVFDLLYKMYEEKGYPAREIPTLILKKNLTGLEIDKRAAQLASFSLIMKARSINSRFFNDTYYVVPEIHEIWDARALFHCDYLNQIKETKLLDNQQIKNIEWLAETFKYGKIIGSLLMVEKKDFSKINESIDKIENEAVINIFNSDFLSEGIKCLRHLLRQAVVMSEKYDVFITNPPYLGISKMEANPKQYLVNHYPNSKADMFGMFMEVPYTKLNGFRAIVNPDSWMFLVSFENLRRDILLNQSIISLIHLGMGAFDAAVQTSSFVIRNTNMNFVGSFNRLVDEKNKELSLLSGNNKFTTPRNQFTSIPGYPIAYWAGKLFSEFKKSKKFEEFSIARAGLSTGDNDKYLRLWHEVSLENIAFEKNNNQEYIVSGKKYVPVNKGGEFRRWFGNNEYIVDWSEPEKFHRPRTTYMNLYYKPALTWTVLTTGKFCARYYGKGFLFDHAAASLFPHKKDLYPFMLGYMNTNVANYILDMINPTLNTGADVVMRMPMPELSTENADKVIELASQNIEMCTEDWNSNETSWEFVKNPLIGNKFIRDGFLNYSSYVKNLHEQLKANEEMLNSIFIEYYGLENELSSEVEEKDVTIQLKSLQIEVKALVSYLIGVEMGRYSLDVEGLVYAGGEWNPMNYVTHQPDDDGIIPVYTQLGMADGLTARIIKLIKKIYGEDAYKDNIDFIADALGKKSSESSEETLNRYLNEGFYADHLKTYQKRPIYWMFSSGKNDAFKCLVYLHRYNEDTLARINSKYFLNESARLNAEVNDTAAQLEAADGREKLRLYKLYKALTAKQKELLEYGWVLDHMANKFIPLDLDDGVKVNYAKFQGIEIVNDNGAKVKKDLLVPIK